MKNSRRGKVHAETRRSRRYEGCAFLFSASSAPPRENGAHAMASLITFVSSAPDGRQGHECQSEVETPQPGLTHEETLGEGRFTRRRGDRRYEGCAFLFSASSAPPRGNGAHAMARLITSVSSAPDWLQNPAYQTAVET